LEHAIIALLDQPDEARRLARNAVESIWARFDAEAEAERLVALYQEVASQTPNGSAESAKS
jgi:hypothetical protein